MARRKQLNPMQRIPSGEVMQSVHQMPDRYSHKANGHFALQMPAVVPEERQAQHAKLKDQSGLSQLAICVLGIYASL